MELILHIERTQTLGSLGIYQEFIIKHIGIDNCKGGYLVFTAGDYCEYSFKISECCIGIDFFTRLMALNGVCGYTISIIK